MESRTAQPCHLLNVRFYVKNGHSLSITTIKMIIEQKRTYSCESRKDKRKNPTIRIVKPFLTWDVFLSRIVYVYAANSFTPPYANNPSYTPMGYPYSWHYQLIGRGFPFLLTVYTQFVLQTVAFLNFVFLWFDFLPFHFIS